MVQVKLKDFPLWINITSHQENSVPIMSNFYLKVKISMCSILKVLHADLNPATNFLDYYSNSLLICLYLSKFLLQNLFKFPFLLNYFFVLLLKNVVCESLPIIHRFDNLISSFRNLLFLVFIVFLKVRYFWFPFISSNSKSHTYFFVNLFNAFTSDLQILTILFCFNFFNF